MIMKVTPKQISKELHNSTSNRVPDLMQLLMIYHDFRMKKRTHIDC